MTRSLTATDWSPVLRMVTDSLDLATPRTPEKNSSRGRTSSGSRIFSRRGAGAGGASVFSGGLGGGAVAQEMLSRPKKKQQRILGMVIILPGYGLPANQATASAKGQLFPCGKKESS
jgi:hypothetical protein